MPVCSYVVFPRPGSRARAAARLASLPGCEVASAEDHDLLILVTSTADARAEEELRRAVEAVDDVQCLVMSFGEIDPAAVPADPGAPWRESADPGAAPSGRRAAARRPRPS